MAFIPNTKASPGSSSSSGPWPSLGREGGEGTTPAPRHRPCPAALLLPIPSPNEAPAAARLSRIPWRWQLLPGRQPKFCLLLSKQTRAASCRPVYFLKTLSSWLTDIASCFHLLGLDQGCPASGQSSPPRSGPLVLQKHRGPGNPLLLTPLRVTYQADL